MHDAMYLIYNGGTNHMTSLKILLKSIDKMNLLLSILIGDKISVFVSDEETIIDGENMSELKSELLKLADSSRRFIAGSLNVCHTLIF